ncbi:hypothetical protein B0A48_09889 [Cryoendolithus antarcticus]|uniref:Endonuclease/exonuclease/phosphatase domain-containing protein n=1 Tax=Cryoendolithus antarcticus TaxID=1507870 RepID=A0A1V8T3B7_9PEZI|nr:hypothetical protein B0A48_09889 [Cryoendolithus antarcticus]
MTGAVSPPPLKRRKLAAEIPAPPATKASVTVDLYSWNVNGIGPFIHRSIKSFFKSTTKPQSSSDATSPSLRDFLRSHSWPTFLFLQEVKTRADDTQTRRAVQRAVSRQAGEAEGTPDYVAHFTLPKDPHNTRGFGGKVYGVCSIVRKDFSEKYVERVRDVAWDQEGRFSVIETKAVGDVPKMAIYNVYMVNGTNNPYKDASIGEVKGTRHDRKLAVHALLAAECRKLVSERYEVIVAGDINIARAPLDSHPNLRTSPQQHVSNRQDFERRFIARPACKAPAGDDQPPPDDVPPSRMIGLGMVDVFRNLHPSTKAYSYYPRGRPFGSSCDRVDMIMCTPSLAASCTAASILATPGDRGPSDHVPIQASFAFEGVEIAGDG